MNKRKLFTILAVTSFVTLMLALTVILFSNVAMAANEATETKYTPYEGYSHQLTSTVAATNRPMVEAANSTPSINNNVAALVMQPTQDQIHAFSALTGEWTTLGGDGFRVGADDIAMVSKLVILVSQPGQEQIHAYSALTGEWATLSGNGFRVNGDDIYKVNDAVIVVAQPGIEQIHAFSALTGEWATLSGNGFRVGPDDIILVGPNP